jgi:hypothetical protein
MSVDFRGLRPTSNDPLLALFVELQKSVLKKIREDQIALLDSDNEDIFSDGQDMDTAIKYHSELGSQQKFTFDKKFYPAGDAGRIKLWLRARDLGNVVKDRSGQNHNAALYGDPTLVDGTLDLGIHTHGVKSIARRMNRPTSDFQNLEWMQVPDHEDLRVSSLTVGFAWFMRVRFNSLAQQGGRDPTLFEKIDDSTPNNAYMLQAKSDGRLVFIVKKGGVTYAKETASPTVIAGAVYDIFAAFDLADNSFHIYVDGTERTLANFTGTVNWQATLTNHDLFIFRRGLGTDGGFCYADFYDIKLYSPYVVSDVDVTWHFENKWTISPIAFGHVMITNYWATFGAGGGVIPGLCSFSETSFSPISFNICVGSGGGGPPPTPGADFYDDTYFDPLFFS